MRRITVMAITVAEKLRLAADTVRLTADIRATMQEKIRLSRVLRGTVARRMVLPTARHTVRRIADTRRVSKRKADLLLSFGFFSQTPPRHNAKQYLIRLKFFRI